MGKNGNWHHLLERKLSHRRPQNRLRKLLRWSWRGAEDLHQVPLRRAFNEAYPWFGTKQKGQRARYHLEIRKHSACHLWPCTTLAAPWLSINYVFIRAGEDHGSEQNV